MKVSSVSLFDNDCKPRKNSFIGSSNGFMSVPESEEQTVETAQDADVRVNKIKGIETITIFPKQVINGKTIITA